MVYSLSIDQSTTSTSFYLYEMKTGSMKWSSSIEFEQISLKPGWLQHNFNQIWLDVQALFTQLGQHLAEIGATPSDVKSVRNHYLTLIGGGCQPKRNYFGLEIINWRAAV